MPRLQNLSVLLVSFFVSTAQAAPWTAIARNAESVVEVDLGSLARAGQSVKVWSRQIYSEEQDLPLGDPPFRAVRYLYNYDCGKRTAMLIRRTYVDEEGQPIKDQMLDGLEMAKDIIPGTLQERVFEHTCKPPVEKSAEKPARAKVAKAESHAEEHSADADTEEHAEEATEKKGHAEHGKPGKGEKASEHASKAPTKGTADPHAKPAADAHAKQAKGKHGEDEAEHEEPAHKGAKPRVLPKAKLAKEEAKEEPEEHEADHGEKKPVRKPEKVAMLEKKSKHDLDEKCEDCEREDSKDEDKAAAKPAHPVHWAYDGKLGPQNWAKLSPEFAACGSGKFQSPIDIKEGIRLSLEPITFNYKPSQLRILDNGHTVQVNYGMGSSITVGGEKYSLVQFHFHKPSEERIEGKSFDMVVHLVHKNLTGNLAVVAVMLRNGAPNPLMQTLWTHLPLMQGKEATPKDVKIDVTQFLPTDRSYYTYLGSLTTPPCSEGVLWLVMKNPMQVSRSQIAAFGRLYEVNARPVQPANKRLIKESL